MINRNFFIGFNKPILHGLCMLGFAVRHLLSRFANYDTAYFDALKARFVGTIIPGQTIETHIWKSTLNSHNQPNLFRIHFECFVKETGTKIISSAFVDLKTPLPNNIDIMPAMKTINNINNVENSSMLLESISKVNMSNFKAFF